MSTHLSLGKRGLGELTFQYQQTDKGAVVIGLRSPNILADEPPVVVVRANVTQSGVDIFKPDGSPVSLRGEMSEHLETVTAATGGNLPFRLEPVLRHLVGLIDQASPPVAEAAKIGFGTKG